MTGQTGHVSLKWITNRLVEFTEIIIRSEQVYIDNKIRTLRIVVVVHHFSKQISIMS